MKRTRKSRPAVSAAGTKGFARAQNLWSKSLDYWLIARGKSEQDLADAIGVSQSQVSHWRTGRLPPPALSNEPLVLRIVDALGLDKDAATRFLDDARMSALPEWAVTIINTLKKRIAKLEKQLANPSPRP